MLISDLYLMYHWYAW